MPTHKTLVAIPVLNEEAAIPVLIQQLDMLHEQPQIDLEVLFVDDGSTDATPSLLQEAAAARPYLRVHTHPRNLGLGAAVQTIIQMAITELADADVLVTLDGDASHDPLMIPSMLQALEQEKLDLVVASRFVPGAQVHGLGPDRKLLSLGASLFFRLFFPIRNVRDYSCGFRAYRVSLLRRATALWGSLVTRSGFECMAEIMAKLSRVELRAGERPLVLRYDRKESPSKMRVLRTVMGYIRLLKDVCCA